MAIPESATEFFARQLVRLQSVPVKKRIIFPEGEDPRVVAAADRLAKDQLVHPILVCGAKTPPGGFECANTRDENLLKKLAQVYFERRRSRGITETEALQVIKKPLYFSGALVASGYADGFVGGAATSTADTFRAAVQTIGTPTTVRTVSSVFLVAVHDRSYGHRGILAFADPALIVDPTPVQLAEIAIATARSVRVLMEVEPTVALLSFSTKGSGKHKISDKVVEAWRIVQARAPELHIDGELQADAALVPAVGQSKSPGSTVAGYANTLIFPDLNSANIGSKLVERLGGAVTMGPFFQGLLKPANDLSRGCSADDIYRVAVITALQAGG